MNTKTRYMIIYYLTLCAAVIGASWMGWAASRSAFEKPAKAPSDGSTTIQWGEEVTGTPNVEAAPGDEFENGVTLPPVGPSTYGMLPGSYRGALDTLPAPMPEEAPPAQTETIALDQLVVGDAIVARRNPETNDWETVQPEPFRYLDLPTIDPESGRHVVIQIGLLKSGGVVWRQEQSKEEGAE